MASPTQPLRCLQYFDAMRREIGGTVSAVLDLVTVLGEGGVAVTLLTGDDQDTPEAWREGADPSQPRAVRISRTLAGIVRPKHEQAMLDSAIAECDVVHVHTPWDPYNPAVVSAAKRAGKPYVVTIHGMLDDWSMSVQSLKKRTYLKLIGRKMLEGAARVHFTAQAERDQALKWAPNAKPAVLPLLMDLTPYDQLPGPELARERFSVLDTDEPRLLFLSRVDPKKGVDLLIQSVAALQAEGRSVQAMVAGPGEEAYVNQLKKMAEQLGVADRIHFLGMVRGDLKWSLYQASDLFVLPTHQENFGIVLVEAMGCSLPTLTTHRVDIWREIEAYGAKIVDDQSDAITAGLRGLLSDLEAACGRAVQGREEVLRWLDPQRITGEYIKMYQEVIDESR